MRRKTKPKRKTRVPRQLLPLLDSQQRYAIPEAAALLRVSRAKVYQLISAGSLKTLHEGARVFIPGSEIVARSTLPGGSSMRA